MSKPWIHAVSSARRFGGEPNDYMEIHNFMDSSKGAIADSRHRALTHTSWFLSTVLERVFGSTITVGDGKVVSVRDVGEQHILEDFGGRFIPTPQDYLEHTDFCDWMLAGKGEPPSSFSRLSPRKKREMSAQAKYLEAKQRAESARETMKECAKEAFSESAKAVFDSHPELKSFSWNQYTPYFNDGDPCTFSAGTGYPKICMMPDQPNDSEDDDDEETEEFSSWGLDKKPVEELTALEKAGLAVVALLETYDEQTYLEMFDDGYKITVSRDGIEVKQYDHD